MANRESRKEGSIWGALGFGLVALAVLIDQHRAVFECGSCHQQFEAGVRDYLKGGIRGAQTPYWELHYNTPNSRPLICPHCHRVSRCRKAFI